MKEIETYVRTTITIMGLAYPILLQVIARLDEKYNSTHIVELFEKETSKRWFRSLLVISLITTLIWTFHFEPLLQINGLDFIINNSAILLVFLASTGLVTAFLFYVNRIITYYIPKKFVEYLIKKHNSTKDNTIFLNAIGDVLLHSIQKQNNTIALRISRFLYQIFSERRNDLKKNEIIYPYEYYSIITKTIEELAAIKGKNNSQMENQFASTDFLIGNLADYKISEATYSWLWNNILIYIKYEKDDMLLIYWQAADQYYNYNLPYIANKYGSGTSEILNQEEIDKRNLERDEFLKINYFLGALLLYKKKHQCIKRIFNFTNSVPYKYSLLPLRMTDVFNGYFKYTNQYDRSLSFLSQKFPFPELEGLKADAIIRKWIGTYFALLFIRQYTLTSTLSYYSPLDFPEIPKTQGEIKHWIEYLPYFKKQIISISENNELLKAIDFDFLNNEWYNDSKKQKPEDYLNSFIKKLEAAYKTGSINTKIDSKKVLKFTTAAKNLLGKIFKNLTDISNSEELDDYESRYINGGILIDKKDPFTSNPEINHLDFETYLPSVIGDKVNEGVALTFLDNAKKRYLLKSEDIITVINTLNNFKDYTFICFGNNIFDIVENALNSQNQSKPKIINLPSIRLVADSVFILPNKELPKFIFRKIDLAKNTKYSLEEIEKSTNLFASVIDLNEREDLRKEYITSDSEEELLKSVLLIISFNLEIQFVKKSNITQLIRYSELRQQGLPNKLEEVNL